MKEGPTTGTDGLPIRMNGGYATQKLSFLDSYLHPALGATETKRTRVYIDLFAGPGRNRSRRGGREFDSGALRALRAVGNNHAKSTFTRAILFNKDPDDHAALESRVARMTGRTVPDCECRCEDSNLALDVVLRGIHPKAYVFAFLDPESPNQLPWSTLERLRRDHYSTDAYILFPLYMGLNRILAWDTPTTMGWEPQLTKFFGTDDWIRVYRQFHSNTQRRERLKAFLDFYVERLHGLWGYVESARKVSRGGVHLYHMLAASNSEAGMSIMRWAANDGEAGAQGDMFPTR
jgi:three-Cys-motif partner protein